MNIRNPKIFVSIKNTEGKKERGGGGGKVRQMRRLFYVIFRAGNGCIKIPQTTVYAV